MNRVLLNLVGLFFMSVFLAGCTPQPQAENGTLKVVSTIGMINDIVKNVGGSHVEAVGLMGAGVDPHLYKASEGDVALLSSADIIFYNGLHLEAKMADILEKMGEQRTVVAVTGLIDRAVLRTPPEFQGQYDPHVWFDVTLWMQAVEKVRGTLVEKDPANAADYEKNAAAYLKKLEELHAYVQKQANTISSEQRVLVTAHDAFGYFGRQYGFDVKGLQGISTASEAGTKDIALLADFIAERKLKAIFVESSVPRKNVEALQEAVRARGWDVVIGGQLYSDAMGDAGTFEGTYVGMVTKNIDVIKAALVGEGRETP